MPTAIVKLQKTGYYVTDADGDPYTDPDGHSWFARDIARDIARRLGGWYEQGSRTTIKEVVTGFNE